MSFQKAKRLLQGLSPHKKQRFLQGELRLNTSVNKFFIEIELCNFKGKFCFPCGRFASF